MVKEKIKQCLWICPEPHCNKQCGGIKNHSGPHQCSIHYKSPPLTPEQIEKFEKIREEIRKG